jgi:hypothetical protein
MKQMKTWIRGSVMTLLVAVPAVGCTAETGPESEEIDSVSQAYSLIACPNDAPASGYHEFPYNDNHYGYSVSNLPDCVSMRVDRNLSFPEYINVTAHALARFPQYEGVYTEDKANKCKNSKVEMFLAKKWQDSSSWATEGILGYGAMAVPEYRVEFPAPPQAPYWVIETCTAVFVKGAGCDYKPDRNLMRMDVRAVANGNAADPGPASVYATFEHDYFCN